MVRLELVLILTLLMNACAGRPISKVAASQPNDSLLSCAHIIGEYRHNFMRLEELKLEEDHVSQNNSAAIFQGLGGLTTLDDSDAQEAESSMLIARNKRLEFLHAEKGCDGLLEKPRVDVQPKN